MTRTCKTRHTALSFRVCYFSFRSTNGTHTSEAETLVRLFQPERKLPPRSAAMVKPSRSRYRVWSRHRSVVPAHEHTQPAVLLALRGQARRVHAAASLAAISPHQMAASQLGRTAAAWSVRICSVSRQTGARRCQAKLRFASTMAELPEAHLSAKEAALRPVVISGAVRAARLASLAMTSMIRDRSGI